MPGKRTKTAKNYRANVENKERQRMSRASDTVAATEQLMYRRRCLQQRAAEGHITKKNLAEVAALFTSNAAAALITINGPGNGPAI
jgi:hypothetical protein